MLGLTPGRGVRMRLLRNEHGRWVVEGVQEGWISQRRFRRKWEAGLALRIYRKHGRARDYVGARRIERDKRRASWAERRAEIAQQTRGNIDEEAEVGYCRKHGRPVLARQFEYKGCWHCREHFSQSNEYVYVCDAAQILNISEATVRKWIRTGKLPGRLFVRGRSQRDLPVAEYLLARADVVAARDQERQE